MAPKKTNAVATAAAEAVEETAIVPAAETAIVPAAETAIIPVEQPVTEVQEIQKPDPRELVQLYIPPASRPNEEKYAMVWVNGRSWSMRKGTTHMVPRYVYDEYQRALNARARALERHENRRKQELEHNAAMAQKIGSTAAM